MKNIFKKFKKTNDPYKVILKEKELDSGNSIPTVEKDDEIYIGGKPEDTVNIFSNEEIEHELCNIFIQYLDNPDVLQFNIIKLPLITVNTNLDLTYIETFIAEIIGVRPTVKSNYMTIVPSTNMVRMNYIKLTFDSIDAFVWYNHLRYSNNVSDIDKVKMSVLYNTYMENNIKVIAYNDFIRENETRLKTLTATIIESITNAVPISNIINLKFRSTEEIILLENFILVEICNINKFYDSYNIKIEIIYTNICIDVSKLRQKEIN